MVALVRRLLTLSAIAQRDGYSQMGRGQTHHFALAVADEDTQREYQARLAKGRLSRLADHGSRLLP